MTDQDGERPAPIGRCTACGATFDGSAPIYRTREAACYVFAGAADDPRTGKTFHTRDRITLAAGVLGLTFGVDPTTAPRPISREEGAGR